MGNRHAFGRLCRRHPCSSRWSVILLTLSPLSYFLISEKYDIFVKGGFFDQYPYLLANLLGASLTILSLALGYFVLTENVRPGDPEQQRLNEGLFVRSISITLNVLSRRGGRATRLVHKLDFGH